VRRREERDKFIEGILKAKSRKRKRDEDDKENEGNAVNRKEGEEAKTTALKKKTKKIRGPNPLSMLNPKPKLKNQPPRDPVQTSAQASESSDVNRVSKEEDQSKSKRRRKHSKKEKPSARGGSQDHEMFEFRDEISDTNLP
jgi:type IV secretory pathway VirB10-like protein